MRNRWKARRESMSEDWSMPTFMCPWCTEDNALDLATFGEEELAVSCPDCGTTVSFVREPDPEVELAA